MRQIVIIGSSIAGVSAAEAARKQDPGAAVAIYSRDTHLPYYRLRIGEVLASRDQAEKLTLHPAAWYADRGIELHLGRTVTAVLPDQKIIRLADGAAVAYDKLILAQGSHSFVPPIPGHDLAGVKTLWTMDDALDIEAAAAGSQACAVIGGGLLGLETAYQVAKQGIRTTVIETAPRLLARQLDEGASAIFAKQVVSQKVTPIVAANVAAIQADASGSKCAAVALTDGTAIPADLVIISTGVRPNLAILDGTGIQIGRFVICNDRMETSLPDVYAAGDVMEQDGKWFGQWSISKAQGTTAGINAAGGDSTYTIETPPYILNTMDTKVAAGGLLSGETVADYSETVEQDESARQYHKVSRSGDTVIGFALVGDTKDFMRLTKAMQG